MKISEDDSPLQKEGRGRFFESRLSSSEMGRYDVFMKPPTYFLSSTIYDFRDLRSALKFYLEEQGCTVLASEHNDFLKPLDKHSYVACLQAIERADYFVLLIGSRIGGWFDPDGRVSITQKEYRHAYSLQQSGKLKILSFVRAEVWQSREDRKELAAYLESLPISAFEKKRIQNFPSKFAEDAAFISDFVSEVGRNRDTANALAGGSPLPSGNWIHVFHDFRDVIAAVQAQMFSGIPVAEAALRRLLKSEVRELLRQCIPKTTTALVKPRSVIEQFVQEHPLTKEIRDSASFVISSTAWDKLSWVVFHLLSVKLYSVILDSAIISPYFLSFSQDLNTFEETPMHRALGALRDEIRHFNESNTTDTLSVIFEHTR